MISSNTGGQKQTNNGGHCPKHCPKAKRTKTDNADPEDTLPDLPVSGPIEASDNTRDMIKRPERSESSLRTVVTLTETTTSIASKTTNIPDVHEPACEQTATS